MYLKEIALENFKSFAKKVRIPLQPGYTVITGPNGSGKSNISDAILFVLGPKSSKVIRAGKLTDLIYNGGKSRNAASFVTVSVVFDNTDRTIPIDSDEVVFTRTVRRASDGDDYTSYFYVNERRSSLGEFDALLRDAKLSADGYNFVQQGDITRIIEMGNTERRKILDDIAGITAFDAEIENAEKERATVETNLLTAQSVLSELRSELRRLESEKKAAERYLAEKKRLDDARLTLGMRRLATTEEELKSVIGQIENYESQIVKLREEAERGKEESLRLQEELRRKDEELNNSGGEEAKQLREKLDAAKIARARNTDAAATSRIEMDDRKSELLQIRKTFTERKKVLEQQRKTLGAMQESLSSLQKEHDAKKGELQELERKLVEGDGRSQKIQNERNQLIVSVTELQGRIREMQLESDRLMDAIDRQAKELALLEEKKSSKEFEFKDIVWKLRETGKSSREKEDELKECQNSFNLKKKREEALSSAVQELEKEIKQVTREYERARAQNDARADIRLGNAGALRAVLEARDKGEIKGVYGTVSELCRIEDKFTDAVFSASGSRMQAVIVEDDGVAAACIGLIKKSGLGRLTFLPLNRMIEGRPRGKAVMMQSQTLGFMIDHMSFDEKFRPAMWYVFGDTLVVGSIDELRRLMGGIRLVTLDGDIAEASGAMIGGSPDRTAGRVMAEKGKVEELGSKLRSLVTESEEKSAELSSVRSELQLLEERIRSIRSNMGEGTVSTGALNSQKSMIEKELNTFTYEIKKLRDLLSESEERQAAVKAQLEEAKRNEAELSGRLNSKSEELLADKPREMSSRISTLRQEVQSLNEQIQTVRLALGTGRTELQFLEKEVSDLEKSIAETEDAISTLQTRIAAYDEEAAKFGIEVGALQKMEDELYRSQSSLRAQRDALLQKKISLEAALSKSSERADTLNDLKIKLKTGIVEIEGRKREIEAEISALTEAGAVRLDGNIPMEKLKEIVVEAEKTIGSIGGVNMLAIESYDHTKSRCDGLDSEINAFIEKKKSLIHLVEEINKKKRSGLLTVFTSISSNFSQIYSQLSGGNEGELVLENSEDPLQGGLLIRVKQKEKKTLRIEALSGGEKSLAALAFIFAIQQYDPSPVYVLDEVDMFLDGINTEAVSKMVRGLSTTAQFLQISLRKVTLNCADRLIGVTKQLSGVSEVFLREMPEENDVQQAEMQGAEE
jgi:chromosome segregation protein